MNQPTNNIATSTKTNDYGISIQLFKSSKCSIDKAVLFKKPINKLNLPKESIANIESSALTLIYVYADMQNKSKQAIYVHIN